MRNALLKDVEQIIVKAGVVGIVDELHGAEQYMHDQGVYGRRQELVFVLANRLAYVGEEICFLVLTMPVWKCGDESICVFGRRVLSVQSDK